MAATQRTRTDSPGFRPAVRPCCPSATAGAGYPQITWLPGNAEALPLPDASATVVWAISSYHHWQDTRAGLREARRIFAAGGRLLIAERLLRKDGHGLTQAQADALAQEVAAAGFTSVRTTASRAGQRTLVVVQAVSGGGT